MLSHRPHYKLWCESMYQRTKMDDQFTEWHSVRPWHPTLSLSVREITSVSVTFILSSPSHLCPLVKQCTKIHTQTQQHIRYPMAPKCRNLPPIFLPTCPPNSLLHNPLRSTP